MPLKRLFLAVMAVALVAAMTVAGFLAATSHHPAKLTPRAQAPRRTPRASAQPSAESCASRKPAMPFTGVAVNTPVSTRARSFAAATGAHLGMVEFYTSFGNHFPQHEAQQAVSTGAIPLIQINPRKASLASITAGHWDGYLRHYAAAMKAFRCLMAFSFGHEMNGNWYPWGRPWSSPAEFIAAWRHIHRVFAAEHVRNVIWSWDPDHGGTPARQWWPGAAYVDWIGVDGYQIPGKNFRSIFAWQLAGIRSFTSKPVFLAETAVAPGPEQHAQIAGLFAAIRKYRLAGVVWFDINRQHPWRLEGNPAAIAAFRAGIRTLHG